MKENIILQPRDRHLIYLVYLHRFMTSQQIHTAICKKWDYSNFNRRLKLLTDFGYLDRPEAQRGGYREGGGKDPLIYAIGKKGGKILMEEPYYINVSYQYLGANNRNVGNLHVNHTLLTTEVLVNVRAMCMEVGLNFIDESEIIRTQAIEGRKQLKSGARGWYVESCETGLIPDRMFAIEDPNLPTSQNRHYFFLESDTGSMPQISANPHRSSIAKKMLAYRETSSRKILKNHFQGISQFDVLFVMEQAPRGASMFRTNQKVLPNGWDRFLFAALHTVKETSFFETEWVKGRTGEVVTIGDILNTPKRLKMKKHT